VRVAQTVNKKIRRGNRASNGTLRDQRERCIEAVKRLEADAGTNCFFDKAMILLTRHWVATPRSGRADLLQTADWLIRVGARNPRLGESMGVAAASAHREISAEVPRAARRQAKSPR